jgi:hypothetical protein
MTPRRVLVAVSEGRFRPPKHGADQSSNSANAQLGGETMEYVLITAVIGGTVMMSMFAQAVASLREGARSTDDADIFAA